ncbi:NAD(P)-binding protein [Metschnikowia bicuspidata var. bicuspidata NRRL YB-4993]|uniref:NAD(P)-binding protein n=1 Tax=Metschnikowia bicuspidata var. bicuspidata NRRL YB-4993 TaxID=869754 RepID=A0A1A0H868_9ASCO|nr:NAD(P)-binding protein [Metschnikowia bicuspidata var. bicuspidata NRRL YB-4993]OBA20216.1 NAD(P)-binding protein [Metschnikowia bicuspidata var. bicuspidata NRRL YB-4993]
MVLNANFYKPESAPYFNPAEERKTAIVTGGNSGIGWYTVLHLYLHGYIVYMAGRNAEKVAHAVNEIHTEAVSRFGAYTEEEQKRKPLGELHSLHLDCCDLKSVEICAEEFLTKESHLDLLINNAGLMAVPFEMTKDGYEIQYQVNLVAPILFTEKLLPALEKTTTQASVPRVITLSSMGHNMSIKYWDPANPINKFPSALYSWVRYGNAKRGAIEYMRKFAQVHPEILAFSVHPGVITDTRLYDWWTSMPTLGPLFKLGFQGCGKVIGVSCEEGALATLRAALDPNLSAQESGSYFVTGGVIEAPSKVAQKQENIDTTWSYNIRLLTEKGFLKEKV